MHSCPAQTAMRQAVADRDARLDGAFVYGVVTTGVYCRPSCTSPAGETRQPALFREPRRPEPPASVPAGAATPGPAGTRLRA